MKNILLTQYKPLAIYSMLTAHSLPFRISFLLIVTILLSSSSCKKEDPIIPPDLPPLTHTGEMTFGCYINGAPWVAQVPPFIPTERHLTASFHKNANLILMTATKVSNDFPREIIKIRIDSFKQNFVNYKNTSSLPYSNYSYRCNNGEANIDFEISDNTNNEIIIEYFSLENRIISGRFSMKVNAARCPDEQIEIRDGRFDVLFSIIE